MFIQFCKGFIVLVVVVTVCLLHSLMLDNIKSSYVAHLVLSGCMTGSRWYGIVKVYSSVNKLRNG